MGYKIFDTEAEAIEYSHEAALDKWLGKAGDICQYWYSWKETANGKWAVQCPDGAEVEPIWKEENNDY